MKYKKIKERGECGLHYRFNFQYTETWVCEEWTYSLSLRCTPINLKRNVRDDWKTFYQRRCCRWNGGEP